MATYDCPSLSNFELFELKALILGQAVGNSQREYALVHLYQLHFFKNDVTAVLGNLAVPMLHIFREDQCYPAVISGAVVEQAHMCIVTD